jgi:hypothetical protein
MHPSVLVSLHFGLMWLGLAGCCDRPRLALVRFILRA